MFGVSTAETYDSLGKSKFEHMGGPEERAGDVLPSCYEEVVAYLIGEPVLSKIAFITKETDNGLKYRLILDCSISGTNSHTRQWERIVLPKVTDVVNDTLGMMAKA